jgi:Mn2+/Fe2+ NRAMP family transporter
MPTPRPTSWLSIIGPGLIVAATGVGAGDLATGAFVGSKLGVAVLWAILLGAVFKWTVNEGLARWQLVTGGTLLEGVATHLGKWAIWLFLVYLVFWTFFVASALMNACGAALHALVPIWDAETDKRVFGIGQSLLTVWLIHLGGFRWFERIMAACIALMFAVVVTSAVAIGPDWSAVTTGLFVPRIPHANGEGLSWTLALIGGVGGTVTVLSYGYWIREEGRTGPEEIRTCRLDLASGYAMTALFGIGMVIIGSAFLKLEGDPNKGTRFVIDLAQQLEGRLGWLGPAARWGFVVGAWCAVFSSMLGVWQSVPFLFADAWRLCWQAGKPDENSKLAISTRSPPYLIYQFALATIPAVSLWTSFVQMQKAYAITGAFFVPILAIVLLALNSRRSLLKAHKSGRLIQAVLIGAVLFFSIAGISELVSQLTPEPAAREAAPENTKLNGSG